MYLLTLRNILVCWKKNSVFFLFFSVYQTEVLRVTEICRIFSFYCRIFRIKSYFEKKKKKCLFSNITYNIIVDISLIKFIREIMITINKERCKNDKKYCFLIFTKHIQQLKRWNNEKRTNEWILKLIQIEKTYSDWYFDNNFKLQW